MTVQSHKLDCLFWVIVIIFHLYLKKWNMAKSYRIFGHTHEVLTEVF